MAEVLITLGIIGIVAALTMPALVANYDKQQTALKLKKTYAVLNQANRLAVVEHGDFSAPGASVGIDTKAALVDYCEKYLFPYLKTVKTCTTDSAECGVVNTGYKYLNGTNLGIGAGTVAFVLPDGVTVFLMVHANGFDFIDVNGKKGPNTIGKDVFRFGYNSTSMHFIGQGSERSVLTGETPDLNTAYGCNNNGHNGLYCGGLIMHDNWEIKDDYPW